ncbi:hypothetical protein QAD02_006183 [Eretmocerus hayati]|uniref:Uncharacterized protein n=1 Tax=Eretmocerus hayati TaxID=131215 RepID=A0ACC2N0K6_9HYME|nr:hypothetical protein QAD02_006183 [Eretmocerus hayati]
MLAVDSTHKQSAAGIDEEMFNDLDDCMIDNLIDPKMECGYNRKFKKRFEAFKNPNKTPVAGSTDSSNVATVLGRSPLQDLTNMRSNVQLELLDETVTDDSSFNSSNEENLSRQNSSRIVNIIPCRLNVKALLHTTHRGFEIRMQFQNMGTVNFRLLCCLLVEYEFEYTKCYRILKERFEELSFESAYYFVIDLQDSAAPLNQPEPALEAVSSNPQNPAEVLASKRKDFAAILYYPHKKATKNQNAINAGGCLYEKYLNKRRNYIKIGIILKEDVLSEDLVPQEQETDLDIVRKGNKPKGVILRLWKTTFLARGAAKDLTTQYELYAPLSFAYGHELWCIDYGLANPNGVDFQGLFNNIIPFIIEIAKEKNRFDESLELLESRGQDHLAALLSLPKLLGVRRPAEKQATKGQKRKRSAHNHRVETPVSDTTPTFGSGLQDITDSFVYNAKNPLEFQAFKNKRKEDSIKNKRPIGPFVTLVGDYADEGKTYDKEQVATESSVDDETQVELFVTVNFIDYKIESNKVLEAVDVCYKGITALKLDFPVECRPIWKFLYYYIYKSGWDEITRGSAIRKFIDEIDLKLKNSKNVIAESPNSRFGCLRDRN